MFFNVGDKVKLSELALAFYPDYKNKVFEVCNVRCNGGLDIYLLKGVEPIFFEIELTPYSKASKLIPEIDMDVKSPKHYQLEGLEPYQSIDIINAIIRRIDDPVRAFRVGNALKYLIRAEKKNGLEDYKKARVYLDWIIKEMED